MSNTVSEYYVLRILMFIRATQIGINKPPVNIMILGHTFVSKPGQTVTFEKNKVGKMIKRNGGKSIAESDGYDVFTP